MIEAFTQAVGSQDGRAQGRLLHPHRLTFARQLRGLSQTSLAERIGCTRATIVRLERGADRPDMLLLGRISLALGLPLSFFRTVPRRTLVLTEPDSTASMSAGHVERLRVLREAELVLGLLDAVHRHIVLPTERVSGYDWPAGIRPASVAEAVRVHGLRIGDAPLDDMVETLEASCGVFVILQRVNGTCSFAGWWGPRPFAILPAAASRVERRLLAARCLGELLLEENNELLRSTDVERFARALLAPPEAFLAQCPPRTPTGRQLLALAAHWGMPAAAALEHRRDLLGAPPAATSRRLPQAEIPWPAAEQPTWLHQVLDLVGTRIDAAQLAETLALHPGHVEELLAVQAARPEPPAPPEAPPPPASNVVPMKPRTP